MTPREVRAIAARVLRGAPVSFDPEDLAQIGHLAALEAEASGRVPAAEPHRSRYLWTRAEGAMRDACRVSKRQTRGQFSAENFDGIADDAPDPEQVTLARVGAAMALARITPRMREVAELVATCENLSEAGRELGITPQSVWKTMRRVRVLAGIPPKPKRDPTHPHSVRMTDAHWQAYQALGGHTWLAAQIEAAHPQVVDLQGVKAIANPSSPVRLRIAPPQNT